MKTLKFLFLYIPVISAGQEIYNDFEADDLTNWYQSNTGHWCIQPLDNNNSLHHCYNDTIAGVDFITFFHDPLNPDNTPCTWQFTITYECDPSALNNWAVILTSNELPSKQGYIDSGLVLGVNYIGNDDELKLWSVIGGEISQLLDSDLNWEDSILQGSKVSMKLEYTTDKQWRIIVNSNETIVCIAESPTGFNLKKLSTFTLLNKYTSTHDQQLSFDDLRISGQFVKDTLPPELLSLQIVDDQKVEICFSEPIKINGNNQFCIQGIGCSAAELPSACLELDFDRTFIRRQNYTLKIPVIEDVFGNQTELPKQVSIYYPGSADIIINEIMADPSPSVLLPEIEYIELFNRTDKEINIKDWQLAINGRSASFSDIGISPLEYLLVIDSCPEAYLTNKKVLTLKGFPSINNDSADIALYDRSGALINHTSYSDKGFISNSKEEGGWSQELINPDNPCQLIGNWQESHDFSGGTPGKINSVYQIKEIRGRQKVLRTAVSNPGLVMVYFLMTVDSTSAMNKEYYTVNNSPGNPMTVKINSPFNDRVELHFGNNFLRDTGYELSITNDLCDCSGRNINQLESSSFMVTENAFNEDIIINEIMFDPEEGYEEFIELVNKSDKAIDLKEYTIAFSDSVPGKVITYDNWPLLPGEYAIVARDYSHINSDGIFEYPEKLIYMEKMPAIRNSEGIIILYDYNGNVIDKASYSETGHHSLLVETKGVSLERINMNASGLMASNWQSASSDYGYMTPAAPNSQKSIETNRPQIELNSEIITPNGDGRNDNLVIKYTQGGGYMAEIYIFDLEGRIRRIIARGILLGTEGDFIFDGVGQNGEMLPTGHYIVYFNAYNTTGSNYKIKKLIGISALTP